MLYGNFCKFEDNQIDNLQLGNLPKYDEFIYYFGVKFPSRSAYVMASMTSALLLLGVLLMTIIFFVYALYVILSQKRLSEMQKDFINNMTHEFKTPISTIKISSDVFLKEDKIREDKRLNKYALIIKEQNERLNSQVEKVLQIAKLEQESFKLHKEPLNLHDVVNTIIGSMEVKLSKKQGQIITALNASNPQVNADKFHLSNIIQNLIDNAIKYCNSEPDIHISTQEVDGKLSVIVKDNGIGIKKEYQNKVFEKFFRVPTGNVHNVKGFGLGLFYIKNICDAHGWKIQLNSEHNKGTQISIDI
jgi:two-component system phosphate regulon sensor histidine kinase PhoR